MAATSSVAAVAAAFSAFFFFFFAVFFEMDCDKSSWKVPIVLNNYEGIKISIISIKLYFRVWKISTGYLVIASDYLLFDVN